MRKYFAEFLGTFVLVFGGCGSAVFAAAFPSVGIGLLGVSLAFGLTVVAGAYTFGPISGGHFNPAVSVGLAAAGRFGWTEVPRYVAAQVGGAIAASAALLCLLTGREGGYDIASGRLAANGYGALSPGHYLMSSALLAEVLLTFIFVLVIVGVTAREATPGMAGLAIGLCLTLVHLIGIPITNLSVNPARSLGPALFVGGDTLAQVWLFIAAPLLGGIVAGRVGAYLFDSEARQTEPRRVSEAPRELRSAGPVAER
jgi:aquaporin Z